MDYWRIAGVALMTQAESLFDTVPSMWLQLLPLYKRYICLMPSVHSKGVFATF